MKVFTKQLVIHLQVTHSDEMDGRVFYAEAATDTGQRFSVRGPYDSTNEELSLGLMLGQIGKTALGRITFDLKTSMLELTKD